MEAGAEKPAGPASLQYLASAVVAKGRGGYEEALGADLFGLMDASGSLWRQLRAGAGAERCGGHLLQCCAFCQAPHVPLDPETNPNHYRFLEVQFRRMNGGTTTGRNVSAGSFVKACSTVLAFVTIVSKLWHSSS